MKLSEVSGLRLGPDPITRLYVGSDQIWPAANLFALTPPEDTPTLTSTSIGASAASGIAGSAGWLREKRVGVAETAVGGAQSSTAALDIEGSTRFRYPAVYAAAGHTANAGAYTVSAFKPGGSTVNARWLFNWSGVTSSPVIEFRLRAPVANPSFGMVYVNGKRVQESNLFYTAAAGAGTGVKLTFPDARPRTITVIALSGSEGDFGGVAVAGGYTVTKPTNTINRRIAFITDSYGNGAGSYASGGASAAETFIWRMAKRMGADEVIPAGIGSTGFSAIVSGQPTSNFAGRIPEVMSMNPHVVVFAGGRNDSATGLQAAAEAAFDQVGSGVERYLVRTSSNESTAVNDALRAACLSRGVRYLDVDINAIPKIADGVHPTFVGHEQLADAAFALI